MSTENGFAASSKPPDVASLLTAKRPASVFVTVAVVASLTATLAAWIVAPVGTVVVLPITVWVFLLVWAGTAGFMLTERLPSGVFGNGMHLAAIFVLIGPFRAFGPAVDAGSLAGLGNVLFWGLLAIVFAGLLFFVGRRLRRRAKRRVARRERKGAYADLH